MSSCLSVNCLHWARAGVTVRQCGAAQVQMSLSQRPSLTAGGEGVTLLHELLGFLRRSLSQQAAVRRAIYQVNAHPLHASLWLTGSEAPVSRAQA